MPIAPSCARRMLLARRRLNAGWVAELATQCNLVTWLNGCCEADVGASEFERIFDATISQFKQSLIDDHLTDIIEARGETFKWDRAQFLKT
eukprot:11530406-Alexandrium_andersonii.AAC.1